MLAALDELGATTERVSYPALIAKLHQRGREVMGLMPAIDALERKGRVIKQDRNGAAWTWLTGADPDEDTGPLYLILVRDGQRIAVLFDSADEEFIRGWEASKFFTELRAFVNHPAGDPNEMVGQLLRASNTEMIMRIGDALDVAIVAQPVPGVEGWVEVKSIEPKGSGGGVG